MNNRREFLKYCGLLSAPLLLPATGIAGPKMTIGENEKKSDSAPMMNFITDGYFFPPDQYIEKLAEINSNSKIEPDLYGQGGPTEKLEIEFAKITGKEKAIYVPSGTMANQLAMKLLNGNKTKVIVPENSHIFRDEADAAQSVHELRLIALGKGKDNYDLNDLKSSIEYANKGFYYDSGLGTVVIENPVRRVQNRFVPIETIKEVTTFCRENGYKTHLDGSRLHIAAAFSGVTVKEYSSYFDTVYISLYKYLNAGGGAILCGEAEIIDQMAHQIKILGGSILRNWATTAMALYYLNGVEYRWQEVVEKTKQLIPELNKIEGVNISALNNGTNSYKMELSKSIDTKQLSQFLYDENISWGARKTDDGGYFFVVNDTMLDYDNSQIIKAWKKSINEAKS